MNEALVTVTIERDASPSEDDYEDNPLMIVHVGNHVIETTATCDDNPAGKWVRFTLPELRYLTRHGMPLIVGLCAFRGFPTGVMRSSLKRPQRNNPNHPANPYQAIVICLGGSRVLFHQLDSHFWRNNSRHISPLRDLLESWKVVVVGLGIKEIAKKLENERGFKIARPVDLRKLVTEAYQKEAVHEELRLTIEVMGLEELDELALDGMRHEKKPASVLRANWGLLTIDSEYDEEDNETNKRNMKLLKYAARDAFLTYQTAVRCIKKSGVIPV